MVDFIKVLLPKKYSKVLNNNKFLEFEQTANEQTGEVRRVAAYRNLKFEFESSGVIIMTGSLHRFFNEGIHNYNDYTIQNLINTLLLLAKNLNIDLAEATLQNIEFGVNIMPPLPVKILLRGLLIHTGASMPMEVFKDISLPSGDYRQVRRTRFYLKAYDKAKHYTLDANLFRWEVKIIKMIEIEHLEIKTLNDLINLSSSQIKGIDSILVQRWNEILYYDNTIDRTLLTDRNKIKLKDWRNDNYWLELFESTRAKNRNKPQKEVKEFRKITNKYSGQIQNKVGVLISKKWCVLTASTKHKEVHINSSYIGLNLPTNTDTKKCKITGLNISMQKEDSLLLSHTGLMYFLKEDKDIFEQVKNKYLPLWRHNLSLEIQIKELAHNIRNTRSNQNIKQRRIYPIGQINLLTQFNL